MLQVVRSYDVVSLIIG